MELIINFTPTGMVPTRDMTPYVPIAVNEVIEDVHQAVEVGITMVHIHARDTVTGKPTYKAEVYADIISGIRKYAGDLIIVVSVSGRLFKEFEKRIEPLRLDGNVKPDMGSLTLGSMNFTNGANINSPEMIQKIASEMKIKGILPELEVFDLGMLNYAKYLESKGLIKPPHYMNLIFGNISSAQADLMHISLMIAGLPQNTIWSLGGIGDVQAMVHSIAIAIGGGVRVGIEDNIWYDGSRTRLARNIDFIKRLHVLAEANGRKIMVAETLRKLLNLYPGNGLYGIKPEP